MQLNKLIENIEKIKVVNDKKNINILNLAIDTNEVIDNTLFICLEGTNVDGHTFAGEAVDNGACALVVNKELPINVPQIIVKDTRKVMGDLAQVFYDYPQNKLKLIGVTGTNGKTTTTYITKKILEEAGYKVGLIGTSANYIGPVMLPPKLTTPDPIDLFKLFNQMVKSKCDFVVMEISAHAIALNKLNHLMFEAVALSNITLDHLDFFKTFENYKNAKLSFFNSKHTKSACFNMDDVSFNDAVKSCDVQFLSMSKTKNADISANLKSSTIRGNFFELNILGQKVNVNLPLPGAFNISNALQATALCTLVNISPLTIEKGLNSIEQVKGRFNIIDTGLDFDVVVDYAHTPDGIENIVNAVNAIKTNSCILVFGCGGNRDATKRPIMGKLATQKCDYVVVTSDNPRFENPEAIIKDITRGITKQNFEIEPDRRKAIEKAMRIAKSEDIIIIAGKGCEDYQEINGIKHHFLDEEVVLSVAKKIKDEKTYQSKRVK